MAVIVPLNTSPNQRLSVSLPINGATLTLGLGLSWNRIGGYWALDIYDPWGGALLTGIPLLTGAWPAANILAPYTYLNIGSAYVINQSGQTGEADNTNLGADFVLLWDDTFPVLAGSRANQPSAADLRLSWNRMSAERWSTITPGEWSSMLP